MILPFHTADQRARILYLLDVARHQQALAKMFVEVTEKGRFTHAALIKIHKNQMSLECVRFGDLKDTDDDFHEPLQYEPRWGYIHALIRDEDEKIRAVVAVSPADAVPVDPRRSETIDVRPPADETHNAA